MRFSERELMWEKGPHLNHRNINFLLSKHTES